MEEILDRASKVSQEAEVFRVTHEETPVQFEANRLKNIQSNQSTSIALRLLKDGRIGYATTSKVVDFEGLLRDAAETAQFGMKAEFEFPRSMAYGKVETLDAEVNKISLEQMVRLGEEMIARVREHSSEVLCQAEVSKETSSVEIMNSRGGRASYKKSVFDIGVEGTLIRGTDMLFVGDSENSCHPITSTETVVKNTTEQLERAKETAAVPSGVLPAIFTPNGVASSLIMPLMAAFNGKTVLEGASPLGNKLGQQVCDSRISLWDDPTLPFRPASRLCDDEGVPSQRTSLLDRGVVANFLYDLQTAALAKKASTGNGSRRGGLPAPSPSAFVFAIGDTSFKDMLADIKEGLVIEQLMGAEQGNILGGDFSGNVLLGYKVENGKIVGRVKNTMVSGNVYQLLKEVAAIGKETRWVGGFLQSPYLYFPRLATASKQ